MNRSLLLLVLIILASYLSLISQTIPQPVTKISRIPLPNRNDSIPFHQVTVQCSDFKLQPLESNSTHQSIPIYDFFLFHDEFDILEIRLFELYPYVTLFLIAESRQTLTGREKPLYLKENWSRFAKYHAKIRRIEVTLVLNVENPWSNEHRMRNEGVRLALANLTE